MYPFIDFLRLETGTGREDWLVLSAIIAALTTVVGIWLNSGGGEQVTAGLRSVISGAVDDIGNDTAAVPPQPAAAGEIQ